MLQPLPENQESTAQYNISNDMFSIFSQLNNNKSQILYEISQI